MAKNKLSKFRKMEQFTQQELADLLGVSRDYISLLERGTKTPGFELAKKIADLFCTTVDEVFFSGP